MAKQKKNETVVSARRVLDLATLVITAGEEGGGDEETAFRLFKDEGLRRQLGQLLNGKLPLALQPCQRLVSHLIPDWVTEVVEDVEPTIIEGSILSFPSFLLDEDGGRVDGEIMRKRAVEMKSNKGLSDVPALLGPDGKGLETIPAKLRGKVYIVLTGTVLRNSIGLLYVPYLDWDGDEWCLPFSRLDGDWNGLVRLVSCE